MLRVNNLVGFGVSGGGPIGIPTVDFTDAGADSGTVSASLTFNTKTSAGPHTFLCVTWADAGTAGNVLNAATWGGVAASSIIVSFSGGTDFGCAIVYWAGAQSGNIVLGYNDAINNAGLTCLSLNNYQGTAVDTDTESAPAGGADLDSLAAPGSGGIKIAVFANATDTTAVTWTNATELSDFDMGLDRHSVAYSLENNAATIDAAGASAQETIVGASLR